MPPRLNKRQQRELEELEALKTAQPSTTLEDDATDEEDVQDISQRRGAFSNVRFPLIRAVLCILILR
jgi:hypothetical protein